MKKIISLLALVCLICCMFPVSALASSDTEYIRNGIHTGIWYSNPATKDALDNCGFETIDYDDKSTKYTGVIINLHTSVIDIYDDLLLTRPDTDDVPLDSFDFYFKNGTIRCNNCRAFDLYDDEIYLTLDNLYIENGDAMCADDYDFGYGGAIYVDGAACIVRNEDTPIKNEPISNAEGMKAREQAGIKVDKGDWGQGLVVATARHSYIKNCYARYGGAIAVCGHDCKITNIIFQSNTGIDNGGNDLYVYWGDCRVNDCTFDKEQEGAAAYITADTYFTGCNITKDMCVGDLHQVFITNPTASILSVGCPEIVYGIGGLAVGFIAAMLIFRKKKVAVSSTAADDEE